MSVALFFTWPVKNSSRSPNGITYCAISAVCTAEGQLDTAPQRSIMFLPLHQMVEAKRKCLLQKENNRINKLYSNNEDDVKDKKDY